MWCGRWDSVGNKGTVDDSKGTLDDSKGTVDVK